MTSFEAFRALYLIRRDDTAGMKALKCAAWACALLSVLLFALLVALT